MTVFVYKHVMFWHEDVIVIFVYVSCAICPYIEYVVSAVYMGTLCSGMYTWVRYVQEPMYTWARYV